MGPDPFDMYSRFFSKIMVITHGHLLIEELSSKLSRSVTQEVAHYADSDPKHYFLPNLSVNVLPKRTGGVCDLL